MMLPMVAFVFAVAGAVAGSFLPPVTSGYYKTSAISCSSVQPLDQSNCQLNLENRPVCTINVATHPQAFANSDCSGILRYIPQ